MKAGEKCPKPCKGRVCGWVSMVESTWQVGWLLGCLFTHLGEGFGTRYTKKEKGLKESLRTAIQTPIEVFDTLKPYKLYKVPITSYKNGLKWGPCKQGLLPMYFRPFFWSPFQPPFMTMVPGRTFGAVG